MKKIICTVTNDLSYDQRMQRICSSLCKAGYEVMLVGRKLKHSRELKKMPFQQKRLKCIFNKGKLFYLEYNLRLFFFLLFQKKYDLICSVDLDTILAGTFSAKIRRKQLVYDAHEYFTEVPEVVERPRVQKIWSKIANYCIPKCDAAYTVCNSLADIFKTKYKKEFSVIRNLPFLNADLNHAHKEDNTYILLYQGMLNEGRGLEEMISAMQYFDKSVVQFWIAGEGDLSIELRELTKKLKVEDRVKFWGFVDPAELKDLTSKADIGINLLKNKGLNYYYSLANKFFDYVMAEKPSINMDFPEYRVHNNEYKVCLLIPELSTEMIKNAIENLLEDKNLFAELKTNCKVAKTKWNWEQEEIKLIEIYDKLLT